MLRRQQHTLKKTTKREVRACVYVFLARRFLWQKKSGENMTVCAIADKYQIKIYQNINFLIPILLNLKKGG